MTNATAMAALSALSDPTRRVIFERLAQGPTAVGKLAETLSVSRPAVSQHLRILKDAGLATEEARGTRRLYRIDPRGLGALREWLDQQWETTLDAFQAHAERTEDQQT